ncbi:DNA internalization-related competence protein ComEC/Rec2 [Oceanobacillus rekensis]|uniref:DNA internalization-related competence protein ComEC/Rec2 n=1 Tax=Oceanobacillus rekensis TaxID=937927 RepID=UPI001FE6906F|nr:DNA internalization-related competence protein ComEC/Rec2 [Oceanobacillus rekensis]
MNEKLKGYWHFVAFAAGAAIINVYVNNGWVILAFLLWLFYLYFYERLRVWPIIISLIVFIFFLSYIPQVESHEVKETIPTEEANYKGSISGPVTITEDKLEFVLKESNSEQRLLILHFPKTHIEPHVINSLSAGAECTVRGTVELPTESRNPGQFDYRNYLLTKGITYQLVLESPNHVSCDGSSFIDRFYTLRNHLLTHVGNRLGEFTAPWLSAIVFGDDSNIDSDTEEIFQRWSLTHIIAISGSNIGLIIGLCYFFLIKLNIMTKEKSQWLMVFLMPVYAMLAGGEPSVWRATVMVVIFILLNKYKFTFSYTDVLSIVFLLLILFDAYIVYHVGFQLSFSVTFVILLSKQWISETQSPFWQVLQISFISQMAIIPIQLAYFSIFQPLSIIINLIIIPYFTLFVIPFMYILLPLTFLPKSIVYLFDMIFVSIHKLVLSFIEFIDANFFFPFLMDSFSTMATALYFILFFIFMNDLQCKRLKRSFLSGILFCCLIMGVAAKPYFSPVGTVTMLDIGQGDAFLIELPYRKGVVMIDAGAKFSFEDMEATESVYKQILKPYFYSRGIRKLDALILTHEDLDHMGSASFIIKEMEVEKLIVSEYFDEATLNEIITGKQTNEIMKAKRNDSIMLGGQEFLVVGPSGDHLSANENSLVLYTEIGGKKWLFTGDIGKSEEKELIETYPNIAVDVLKVAHHGSNTSTDQSFLNVIDPQFALISVGENNTYGHPALEVIESLNDEEIVILRTDTYGAVQYIYNRQGGTFYTHNP